MRETGYKDKNGTAICDMDTVEITSKGMRCCATFDFGKPELAASIETCNYFYDLSQLDSNDLLVITKEMESAERILWHEQNKKRIEIEENHRRARVDEIAKAIKEWNIPHSCIVMFHSEFCKLKDLLASRESYKEGRSNIVHGKLEGMNVYIDERFCEDHSTEKIVIVDEKEYLKYCELMKPHRAFYE